MDGADLLAAPRARRVRPAAPVQRDAARLRGAGLDIDAGELNSAQLMAEMRVAPRRGTASSCRWESQGGWELKLSFEELFSMMVQTDVKRLSSTKA